MVMTLCLPWAVRAQAAASIGGKLVDQSGAVILKGVITAECPALGVERLTETDAEGSYLIDALPVGDYRLEVRARGFQTQIVEAVRVEVGRRITQDFRLQVGDVTQEVIVMTTGQLIEHATVSVGQVIDRRTVQELPLNGRRFIDLGLLVPGSVTPPQSGNLSRPARGQGSFALNTAGNREDTVNYQVNGINLNDQIVNVLAFLPSISSIQEFKFDNSTFSAEYGRNSGGVVQIATRSGTKEFHGELFEFFRNDRLDARNFFELRSNRPAPFKRHQFGGSFGGPLPLPRTGSGGPAVTFNRETGTFFFFSYEGLRQREGVVINSLVLSDPQRSAASDPVVKRLLEFVPRGNFTDSSGASRFVGAARSVVGVDQWALDISHNFNSRDRAHGYYAVQRDGRNEPTQSGNTVPGFGDNRGGLRQIFTLNLTSVLSQVMVNEARFGFNRYSFRAEPVVRLNPAELGISNGVNQPVGLPQINVAGGLNFGGPRQPQGRGDTSFVASDTLSRLSGRHSIKVGGEYRRFYSNLYLLDTGLFSFPSVGAFIEGRANAFSITLGDSSNSVSQGALDLFALDSYRWRPNLTFELGLRYAWNMSPTERFDRLINFDPRRVALVRVGTDVDQIYKTNAKNFQPRIGLAWDPFGDGRTSVRAAYALMTEQPMTNVVLGATTNPPLATPLTITGAVRFDNAINLARSSGVSPVTVDPDYDNTYVQSWNLNVQRELHGALAVMVGYFGSKGTHLRLSRNINQPVNGVRPFPRLSDSSPILPGATLGNITQVEGTGNSSYNALWASATRRFSRGWQLNASYTWSKSIDYNSLSTPHTAVTAQDSYNLRANRGLSDFDARHRFVLSGIYDLPFGGNRFLEGWQLATIVQSQSGNPVNIITTNSTVNGVANTLRPDAAGPVPVIGSVDRWFDPNAFTPVSRFGNLGRNVIIGPAFHNVDFSVVKNTRLSEKVGLQFRAEAFDLFNRANFGQPGRIVGTQAFGRITDTRFPTGDSGSSRQLQFALKLMF